MSVETAIYERLRSFAGLTALIGTSPARVYALRLPQKVTLPAVTYRIVSGERFSAMGEDVGDVGTRVQVDAWSDEYDHASRGVLAVAEQIRAALTRFMGTSGGVEIQDIYLENEIDLPYEHDVDAPYHRATDFRVFSTE